jgi:hypothetical protein
MTLLFIVLHCHSDTARSAQHEVRNLIVPSPLQHTASPLRSLISPNGSFEMTMVFVVFRCFFGEILHFACGSVQDDGVFGCFLSEISHFA